MAALERGFGRTGRNYYRARLFSLEYSCFCSELIDCVVYGEMVAGAFGSLNGLAETLLYTTPILLTALATILSFRCGIWNVGGDGQLYLGAIATVGLGFNPFGLPSFFLLPVLAAGAFVVGVAWAVSRLRSCELTSTPMRSS